MRHRRHVIVLVRKWAGKSRRRNSLVSSNSLSNSGSALYADVGTVPNRNSLLPKFAEFVPPDAPLSSCLTGEAKECSPRKSRFPQLKGRPFNETPREESENESYGRCEPKQP